MASAEALDIRVVYDAKTGRGRRKPARPFRSRPVQRWSWYAVGALNLLVAGALCYGAWWRVDREIIYPTLIMKTSFSTGGVNLSGGVFVSRRTNPADTGEPASTASPQLQIDRNGIILGGSAYGWLTLTTAAACALGLSGGALLGRAGGATGRRIGLILCLACVVALGVSAYLVLSKYGMRYPSRYQRIGMAGLVGLAAAVGMAAAGRVRGLAYLAGIMLVLSGLGTVAALYLGVQCDALAAERATPQYLAIAFAAHSAWGWLLLPIARRLRS
jgi:hypothetical protein